MKMSDVFKLPMVQGSIVLMSNDHRYVIEFDNSYSDVGDQIEHVAHAINSHDRMTDEIAELREALTQSTEMLGNFWSNTGSLGALSQKEANEKVLAKHK